jgi:tetratricopeptide (TPR) repeat protein
LLVAKTLYESALPILTQQGSPEEAAETQMNLGLVMQSLVPYHRAQLADCIRLYQQALEVFTAKTYPQEFAILQNNIAIAYLSMTSAIGRDDLKQAIAIQTFEQSLESINLIDHPSEYAMLQNNLGNALQYLPSTHPVENNLRALTAYDEALKVRTAEDTPLVYAHTIANRANVLMNLPDDLENAEGGNPRNLEEAATSYREAEEIFLAYQQFGQAETVRRAYQGLSQLLAEAVS